MRLRIESAVAAANVSAQSPPCNQNAFPSAASAIRALRSSHSPAKTNGGNALSSATAAFTCGPSGPPGQVGCWAATRPGVNRVSNLVLELRSLPKEKHFGYKVAIVQKHLHRLPQIQLETVLKLFFKWLLYCSTTQAFQ